MEPQQQQQEENQVAGNNDQQDMSNGSGGGGGGNNKGGGTTFLCRQSSTRWTPTSDQIRILKDLYYNNGVRSPSAEQIQRISARLRQYGKIEGKNVFYWFQNHKARERQKKRFTSDNIQRPPPTSAAFLPPNHLAPPTHNITPNWKTDHQDHHMKYSNFSPVVSSGSPSSASMLGVNGQMGHYGYGAVAMEKAFRDCGTSSGSISHNFGWVGVDPYSSPYALLETRSSSIPLDPDHDDQDHDQQDDPDDDHDDEELATAGHIETLPLFPMHRDEDLMMINGYGNMIKPPGFPDPSPIGGGGSGYYPAGHVSSRTSLELTLNSYRPSPDSL